MFANDERDRILSARHLASLSERQLRICAALVEDYTDAEIAVRLFLAPSSVRREIAEVIQQTVQWTDLTPGRWVVRRWTPLHYGCCTRRCEEMIRMGTIFAG